MTQRLKVIEKLNRDGFVDNFWAVDNYILRLGSRINDLKKEGYEFTTEWGTGGHRKNYIYRVKVQPELNRVPREIYPLGDTTLRHEAESIRQVDTRNAQQSLGICPEKKYYQYQV